LGTPEGPRRSPPRPNHSEKHGRRGPGALRPLAYLHPSSRSEPLPRPPCERGANTSPTTSVHTRATFRRQILEVCAAFVAAKARAYPRFPRRNLNGKEGVDGSSPSEGLKYPQICYFCCLFRRDPIRRSVRPSIASRYGDPNQVVSASRNPVSLPSPTQAMYPSGLISTAAGAATWPRTGSSQSPAYLASIN
jgi:hypothetical protein